MNVLRIVTIADKNPILHHATQNVDPIDDKKIQRLIDEMIPTMYYNNGVGLAAPQINRGLRLATVVPNPDQFDAYKQKSGDGLVIINPRIVNHSIQTITEEEGCLSVPGIFGSVKRWGRVTIEYYDREGKKQSMNASGLLARIFQHEIDHLDGILYIQKAKKLYKLEPSQK